MCKGIDPESAWGMRMDVSLMMLAARIKLMERAKATQPSCESPAASIRGDGKREVPMRGGLETLRISVKNLQGRK